MVKGHWGIRLDELYRRYCRLIPYHTVFPNRAPNNFRDPMKQAIDLQFSCGIGIFHPKSGGWGTAELADLKKGLQSFSLNSTHPTHWIQATITWEDVKPNSLTCTCATTLAYHDRYVLLQPYQNPYFLLLHVFFL